MVTFEKHILNVLNKMAKEEPVYGEFFIIKSHKKGTFNFQKKFSMSLNFRNIDKSVEIIRVERTIGITEENIVDGYEAILEEVLCLLLDTKKDIWNLINSKLQ